MQMPAQDGSTDFRQIQMWESPPSIALCKLTELASKVGINIGETGSVK